MCMDKLKLLILSHVKLLHLCNLCLYGLLYLIVSYCTCAFLKSIYSACV